MKQRLKKSVSLLLAVMMVVSLLSPYAWAAEPEAKPEEIETVTEDEVEEPAPAVEEDEDEPDATEADGKAATPEEQPSPDDEAIPEEPDAIEENPVEAPADSEQVNQVEESVEETVTEQATYTSISSFEYQIDDDKEEATITNYTGTDAVVSIPNKINGYPVVKIANNAFKGKGITAVTLPNQLRVIGSSAFENCRYLTGIDLPASIVTVGEYAFRTCTKLTTLTMQYNPTLEHYVKFEGSAFKGCTSLTNVSLSENVREIGGYMFSGCTSLTSLTLPESVKKLGPSMIENTGITTITIPKSANAETIYQPLDGCPALHTVIFEEGTVKIPTEICRYSYVREVIMPDSVTEIPSCAFAECAYLTSIELPSQLTTIGTGAFLESALTEIHIPSTVRVIRTNAFGDCRSLANIQFDEGTTSLEKIEDRAFRDCSALKQLSLPEGLSKIQDTSAFEGCTSLTSVTLPKSISKIGARSFYNCSSLTTVSMQYNPEVEHYVTIGSSAFSGCSKLSNVTLSENVTEIGDCAFRWCTALKQIILPESVTKLGALLFQGTRLTSITIPKNVTECNYMNYSDDGNSDPEGYYGTLSYCTTLTEVILEDGMTRVPDYLCRNKYVVDQGTGTFKSHIERVVIPDSVTEIGKMAFKGCINLVDFRLPNSLTAIGERAFQGCERLQLQSFPSKLKTIGIYSFECCYAISRADLLKSIQNVGEGAFQYCTGLEAVTMRYNKTPGYTAVFGNLAFKGCTALSNVSLSENVKKIPTQMFYGCSALEQLTIPGSVTELGGQMAQGTLLRSITIPKGVKTCGTNDNEGPLGGLLYLKEVIFEDGMTTIPANLAMVKSGTSYFTKLQVPESVTSYGANAFTGCNVEDITVYGKSGSYAQTIAEDWGMQFSASDNYDVIFSVSSPAATRGTTVTVPVMLEQNTGMAGFAFDVRYDHSLLTLTGATPANELGGSFTVSGDALSWYNVTNYTGTGLAFNLIFQVAENEECDHANITLAMRSDLHNVVNEDSENLRVLFRQGKLTIRIFDLGDVTGDGETTIADVVKINRFVLGKIILTELELIAADVTGDSDVTIADVVRVNRFVLGKIASLEFLRTKDGLRSASGCSVAVGNVTGAQNGSVDIPVTISGNPGIAGLAFEFTLPDGVVLNSVTAGDVLAGGTFSTNGNVVSWFTGDNVSVDGTLMTLHVTLPATIGEYDLSVGLRENKASNLSDEDGIEVAVGFINGTITVEEAACTHVYHDVVTAPTCTERGYTTHTCEKCNDSYQDTFTNALGHSWDDGTVTTPATCKSEGVMTYTCSGCGESHTEPIAEDPNNHVGGTEIRDAKDATCGEEGYTGDTCCKGCGVKLSSGEVINAKGHKLSKTDAKAATCTKVGNTAYWTCSQCHKLFSDEEGKTETTLDATVIKSEGHQLTKTNAKVATCTEDGNSAYWTCSECHKLFSDEKGEKETTKAATVVKATGHTWDNGTITTPPTTTAEGVKTYTCTVCKQTKTERIAKVAKVAKVANTITGAAAFTKTVNVKKDQSFNLGASANGAALSYKSSNKKVTVKNGKVTIKKGYVGKATITITAAETDQYLAAQKKVTVTVNPSVTQLSSVKWDAKKKVANITWKKNTTGKGYEIQVSLQKNFKKVAKKAVIKTNATVKTTISGLKKGTYYVRMRTVNGKTSSAWSKYKTLKIAK